MEYLFSNFLNDVQQYRAAQAFWESLCKQILAKYDQSAAWKTWFREVELDNGSILRDGNPIYSLVNRKQAKGVTIIQQDPKIHTKWEMAAFVNTFGDEHYELGEINNLVFACNLSQESADMFEKLFEAWIQPECKLQDIEQTIKSLGIG